MAFKIPFLGFDSIPQYRTWHRLVHSLTFLVFLKSPDVDVGFSLRDEPCWWVDYAMLIRPDKAETAVHACLRLIPARVCMPTVMATPRDWCNMCAPCFLSLLMRTLSTSMSIWSDGCVLFRLGMRQRSSILKHKFVQFWESKNSMIKQATVDNNPRGESQSD